MITDQLRATHDLRVPMRDGVELAVDLTGGTFFPYLNEHDDGYDVIEWIAPQDWCDGNIGVFGGSYDGQVQWQAASRTPPHSRAIVPICYDEFWARGGYGDYERIAVPALNVTGWWDLNFPGAPENFSAMRERGGTAEARSGQKLVIGPWPHGVTPTRVLSGVDFGADALIDVDTYALRFFDRWLRDECNQLDHEPPVYL